MSHVANFYFGWIFYDMLCAILMLIAFRQVKDTQRNLFVRCFIFAFLLLAIFGNSISPDYLNYVEMVDEIASTKDPFVHVEPFYIALIHLIGNNFYLYQTCIYVPAFIGIYYMFTKVRKLEYPILFLLLFVTLVLYSFIVGRSYVFVAIYLLALSLLTDKKYLWAILMLISSFFFHKLSYIGLPLVLLYFLPLRLNWKTISVLGILFFISLIGIRYLLDNYFLDLFTSLEDAQGKNYLLKTEGANEGGSFWWQIIYTYQKVIKYFFAFIALFFLKRFASLSFFSFDRMMYVIVFWTSVVSLFLYCVDLPDETIASRTFSIGIIPLCYLLSVLPLYISIKQVHKVIFFFICLFYMMFNNAYIVGVSHSSLH